MKNKNFRQKSKNSDFIWVYGKHSVFSVLENPERKIYEVVYNKIFYLYKKQIEARTAQREYNFPIKAVEKKNLEKKFNSNQKHQGIAVKCDKLKFKNLDLFLEKTKQNTNQIGLILDGITDINNIGAIYRTSFAFEADFIITEKKKTPLENSTLINASCGTFDKIATYRTPNINSAIKKLKSYDWEIVGLDENGDFELDNFLSRKNIQKNKIFILGSEGNGIRRLIKKNCDYLLKIKVNKMASSINVSNSAAILLYSLSLKKKNNS